MKKIIILICIFFLVSCSPSASIDAIPEAKELANKFIKNFEPEKFQLFYDIYHEDFWTSMPQETWDKALPNVHMELGGIEKCELSNWQQSTQATTGGSGHYVSLIYSCKHTKYDSQWTFLAFKPLAGGETKIINQTVSSLGLLLE